MNNFVFTKSQQRKIKNLRNEAEKKKEKNRKKNSHRRNRKESKKRTFLGFESRSKRDNRMAKIKYFKSAIKNNKD